MHRCGCYLYRPGQPDALSGDGDGYGTDDPALLLLASRYLPQVHAKLAIELGSIVGADSSESAHHASTPCICWDLVYQQLGPHPGKHCRDFKNERGLDMRWWEHEATLQSWGRHNLTTLVMGPRSIWTMSPTDPIYVTGNFTDLWAEQDAVDIHYENDYLVPLLLSNPHYRVFFDRYFPGHEVFHPLSRFLFNLHPRHEAAAKAFRTANFGAFTVGLQIRTQKPLGPGLADPGIDHYCALARAVQLKGGLQDDRVRFFVATDSDQAIEAVKRSLGSERVVSTSGGGAREAKGTKAGNPGTEESAVLDMRLLSMTDALVVTSASSFGYVAAAWGGIIPIHVLHRGDRPSMLNPYFYVPLDSEPCYWGAHRYFMEKAPTEAKDLLKANPMWMQYAHCQ